VCPGGSSAAEGFDTGLPSLQTAGGPAGIIRKGMDMKSAFIAAVAVFGLATGQAAIASEALAKSNGCVNCHAVDTKKIGPAFKVTAEKYKGKADAEAKLVAEIKAGKPHPPVKVSDDDLKALIKWILAM
jgi:cytochrome c